MSSKGLDKVRQAADDIFDAGCNSDHIRAALAELGDQRAAFLQRLAVRASLQAAESFDTGDEPPVSLLEAVIARYEVAHGSAREVDLAQPAAWIAAKAAFGDDTPFLMKLFERRVTQPSRRFITDAADAIGVTVERLVAHFARPPSVVTVGIERKASGKQAGPESESFEAAVEASKLPEAVKKRWLSE